MTAKPLTPLAIHRVLARTNCGRCGLPSCFAFAAAVVAGRKKLNDCPLLDPQVIVRLSGSLQTRAEITPDQAEFIDRLEEKVAGFDLEAVAPVIGAVFTGSGLLVNSLGKDFLVDRQGGMSSECHIIPWVKAPLLSYITHAEHRRITGTWISFRELQGGMEWQNLFTSRCELVLKKIADDHPQLFGDLITLFQGKTIPGFQADIALVLHPLPHIPLLICYQAPDDDLESELTIFFDSCCGTNLHIKSIFTLCSGLVQMFDKIATLHS